MAKSKSHQNLKVTNQMSFCFSGHWLQKGSLPFQLLPELGAGQDFLEGSCGLNPIVRLFREETKKRGFSMRLKEKE